MSRTVRIVIAVVAGAASWAILWNLGTLALQGAFPDALSPDGPIENAGALWGLIAYSVALSVLAGYLAATVGREHARTSVWILALLQLGLGIAFQWSFREMMPLWYHLVFLGLVVPATVVGGNLRMRAWAPAT